MPSVPSERPVQHAGRGTLARFAAVAEACLATAAVVAAYKALKIVEPSGWNVAPGATMLVSAAALLALGRCRRLEPAGTIETTRWTRDLPRGVSIGVVLAAILVLLRWSVDPHGLRLIASPWVVAVVAAAVLLGLLIVAGTDRASGLGLTSSAAILVALVLAAHAVARLRGLDLHDEFRLFVSRFVFTALGEELLFRGWMQARLNGAFGRPWRFAGVPVGPGVLVMALLFGSVHALNPAQPFAGAWNFDWTLGIATALTGSWLGLLREISGGIWAGTVVHAVTAFLGGVLST